MTSKNSGDLIAVARVVGAHGIRGEIKVEPLTDFPERFESGSELLLVAPDGRAGKVRILAGRAHKNRYLLFLEGVTDRNAAEDLRGFFLKVEAGDLTPLPEGRYYHFQLQGLEVLTEEGERLGPVREVMDTGSNLVLAVGEGKGEVLLPFIDDVVLDVDLDAGEMTVRLLEGLR